MPKDKRFVVAGHLCMDFTPELSVSEWPQPAMLTSVGPLRLSMGGAVPNVGLALKNLGERIHLVGCVGDDWVGQLLIDKLQQHTRSHGIRPLTGKSTGYSVVIAPQKHDRAFMHCTGANAFFTASDLKDSDLSGSDWMHFGYPPVMPAIVANEGAELAKVFERAKSHGLHTSLDLCSIDDQACKLDWGKILSKCAKHVTVFTPTVEELRVALKQPERRVDDISDLPLLGRTLEQLGFSVVVIKVGARGLYLLTTGDRKRLTEWGLDENWREREMLVPCFEVEVRNTNGAGDCTIAGLISAIASGAGPEDAMTIAAATGASSAEAMDASSGVQTTQFLYKRIQSGWKRLPSKPNGTNWTYDSHFGLWNAVRIDSHK